MKVQIYWFCTVFFSLTVKWCTTVLYRRCRSKFWSYLFQLLVGFWPSDCVLSAKPRFCKDRLFYKSTWIVEFDEWEICRFLTHKPYGPFYPLQHKPHDIQIFRKSYSAKKKYPIYRPSLYWPTSCLDEQEIKEKPITI